MGRISLAWRLVALPIALVLVTVAAVSGTIHSAPVVELIFPAAWKQQAHEAKVVVASIRATG
jgi:hypothetical protein